METANLNIHLPLSFNQVVDFDNHFHHTVRHHKGREPKRYPFEDPPLQSQTSLV